MTEYIDNLDFVLSNKFELLEVYMVYIDIFV